MTLFVPVSHATVTALQCGWVFDSVKGKMTGPAIIVVEDNIIVSVNAEADVYSISGLETIDLSTHTCLPGLIDAHTHLMYAPNQSVTMDGIFHSSADKTILALKNAKTMLHSGFTTIRVPGDADRHYGIVSVKNAIKRGDVPGPRMYVAPHHLSPIGGHSDFNELAADLVPSINGQVVAAGVDAIRDAVRKEIKYGADWIKIVVSGGVTSEGDDPEVQGFTDEEIKAFIDEAHRYGKKVSAHIMGDKPAYTAAKYGIDAIDHAVMISPKTAKLMAKNNVKFVTTAYVLDWVLENGEEKGLSEHSMRKAMMVAGKRDQAFKSAMAAGVTFVFGADQIFPHEYSAREFSSLVKLGFSPEAALQTATINAADMLGIKDHAGSIEVGKWADIVAVQGNIIMDIKRTEHVDFVMQAGIIIKQSDAGDQDLIDE
jgi:imidazolonepropionase-like amidohydrolase